MNEKNFADGFLVFENLIAGVTELAGGVFAAYITNFDTTETVYYAEFESSEIAIKSLLDKTPGWTFESVGCSSHQAKATKGCGSCECA